ncbi:MAG: ABC transporter substrate-binding protein [Chloroflexi bacterium]|nr:ABC transporter substrate-binding protein [Chloroflexota bacterium]
MPAKEATPVAKEAKPEIKEAKPAAKEARAPVKMKVAYSAISAAQAPLWVAKDKGLFDKYGLDVELAYIATGTTVVQAMVAGDISVAHLGGGNVINAVLGGADLVAIAGATNVLIYGMYGQPNIARVEDLKGKAVAITRFGSVTDFAARYTLQKYGLQPEKDVTLVQVGGAPEILAAIQSGATQAGLFAPPTTARAKKLGLREVVDITALGIPYSQTAVAVRKEYLAKNQDTVRDFLKAFVEGIFVIKKEKDFAMKVIGKYSEISDSEVLEDSYDIFANKVFPKAPYVTPASLQTILDEISQENPRAKTAKPEDFIDMRYVKELEDGGFIKRLYGD